MWKVLIDINQLFILFLLKGALEMRNKTVKDTFTPLDKVYMVSVDDKLDDELMQEVRIRLYILIIFSLGYGHKINLKSCLVLELKCVKC